MFRSLSSLIDGIDVKQWKLRRPSVKTIRAGHNRHQTTLLAVTGTLTLNLLVAARRAVVALVSGSDATKMRQY